MLCFWSFKKLEIAFNFQEIVLQSFQRCFVERLVTVNLAISYFVLVTKVSEKVTVNLEAIIWTPQGRDDHIVCL